MFNWVGCADLLAYCVVNVRRGGFKNQTSKAENALDTALHLEEFFHVGQCEFAGASASGQNCLRKTDFVVLQSFDMLFDGVGGDHPENKRKWLWIKNQEDSKLVVINRPVLSDLSDMEADENQ